MSGIVDSLIGGAWEFLSPNLGGIALFCVGIGIVLGIIRKMIDQFGNTKVLIGIGAIVVSAWAVRYVTAPAKVEVREIEKRVVVDRIVPDTSSIDAMKRQLEAVQRDREKLAVQVNAASKRAEAAEAEIEHRDAPKVSAKAAFDERYSEARVMPKYSFKRTNDIHRGELYSLTIEEARGEHLVNSVYEGRDSGITAAGRFIGLYKMTISVLDRDMRPVGRTETYDILRTIGKHRLNANNDIISDLPLNKKGRPDEQRILDGFASGDFKVNNHDEMITDHLEAIKQYQDKVKRRADEYAKRSQ